MCVCVCVCARARVRARARVCVYVNSKFFLTFISINNISSSLIIFPIPLEYKKLENYTYLHYIKIIRNLYYQLYLNN